MTDHDLAVALDRLADTVTNHRVDLASKIGQLTQSVATLQTTHESSEKKLDEVLRLELSCPARGGWDALGKEIGAMHKKDSDTRIWVEGELRGMRGELKEETTGQIDVAVARAAAASEKTSSKASSSSKNGKNNSFMHVVAPWIIKGLIVLGASLGAGLVASYDTNADDTAARIDTNSMRYLVDTVRKVEARVKALDEALIEEPSPAPPEGTTTNPLEYRLGGGLE